MIGNVTGEDDKKACFHGKNAGRAVNGLHSLAHAVVEKTGA